MKRNRRPLTVVLGMVALLGLAGCGSIANDSYAVLEDSAGHALSVTFSFSAEVANWFAEPPEPQLPRCAATGLRG